MNLEKEVTAHLRKSLPTDRFRHVLGVTMLAGQLAGAHKMDTARARTAGILHDLARCWNAGRLIRYAVKHNLKIPRFDFVRACQPVLIHSFVSARMAQSKFKVTDREILSAIEKHSTGHASMSRFEKLIFLADLLAPDRTFRGLRQLRALAFRDLDLAFVESLRAKMEFLLKTHSPIHPDAVQVWNTHVLKTGRK